MNNKDTNTNFWISYADLMAGLLFVFILLIGAIIVKYSLLQSESKILEQTLIEEKIALEKNKKELKIKEQRIQNVVSDLEKTKDDLKSKILDNEKLKITLNEKKEQIKKQNSEISTKDEKLSAFDIGKKELEKRINDLDSNKKELLANIKELDDLLKSKDEKIDFFTKENKDFKNSLEKLSLEKNNLDENIKKLEALSKEKEKKLNELLEDVLVKEKLLDSFKNKSEDLENNKLELVASIMNLEKNLKTKDEQLTSKTLSEKELQNSVNQLNIDMKKLQEFSDKKKNDLDKLLGDILEKEKLLASFMKKNKELQQSKIEMLFKMVNLEDIIKSKDKSLEVLSSEKNNLELNVNKLEKLSKTKEAELDKLFKEIEIKERLIASFKDKNSSLEDEMKVVTTKLLDTENVHKTLTKDLSKTKEKIKSLTGIKIKVISLLKNKLGKNIQIDPKNGSLRLSSNILFDEGEYELKESSKEALKSAVYDYFQTILDNSEINKHIDKIVIEGHTNTKGAYLFNLELSQKRAYSVMDFLLSMDFEKKENLKNLVVASGRSFLDPIYTSSGEEDKDASRRIEIKFNIKNEEAIKEIANILD